MAVKKQGFVQQDTPRQRRPAQGNRQPGYVYILHFRSALVGGRKSSRHYIGWARNWIWRVQQHRRGTSRARIMEVVFERGIAFDVALVMKGGPALERQLKRAHHHARYCPLCGARQFADYRTQGIVSVPFRPGESAAVHETTRDGAAACGKLWGVDYA
jgi:hypothetical protein